MGKAKIDQAISEVLARGDKVFVPYIMAGDGGLDHLNEQIEFLQECGATVIELGVPFSDPVADGSVIQKAGIRSLAKGTTLEGIFTQLAKGKKEERIPIVLMTYINLIYVYGIEAFAKRCLEVGVDGVIIPDVPLEEEELVAPTLTAYNIAFIRLVAPTTPERRMQQIGQLSEGFLYAVTVKGTTGVRDSYDERLQEYLQKLKQYSSVPVLAGFGVSTPQQVQSLSSYCDGVIVGSKIVQLLHEGKREEIAALVRAAKTTLSLHEN